MKQQLLAAVLATVVLGAIGIVSVAVHQPLLVPSLGSAAFAQLMTPEQPTARPWNTGVGQAAGVIGGLIGVGLAHAAPMPSFMGHHPLVFGRVLAVAVAVLATALLAQAARATGPAAGATALVLALGAETPDWAGIGRMVGGIVLVTALGEAARRLVLRAGPAAEARR